MCNVYLPNRLSILLLISFVHGIRCQWEYLEEEKETVSQKSPECNFNENQSVTNITSTTVTVGVEKFDDYELKRLFVKRYKLFNHSINNYKNELETYIKPPRKPRAAQYRATSIDCHSCYATGSSKLDLRCYGGFKIPTTKCADAESCFTEIHPEYLRRGCVLPGRVNRTFVCKCPLCNDKPSDQPIHYEYTSINDWAYDNMRLGKRLLGMDLMCKVCETKGVEVAQDRLCRSGKGTEYMICPINEICYTNIDDEIDFVSRGCINRPAYNSIFFFCNTTYCNRNAFLRPKLRIEREKFPISFPQANLKSYSIKTRYNGCSSHQVEKLQFIVVSLLFIY